MDRGKAAYGVWQDIWLLKNNYKGGFSLKKEDIERIKKAEELK